MFHPHPAHQRPFPTPRAHTRQHPLPAPTPAQGDVLEVSAGTGRNLPYYDLDRLKSLTLTDTSRQMLLNARDKYDALRQRAGGSSEEGQGRVVRFALGDGHRLVRPAGSSSSSGSSSKAAGATPAGGEDGAAAAVAGGEEETRFGPALRTPQTFEPESFDCVVDTFGLCSHDDPVQVLKVRDWGLGERAFYAGSF